MIAALPVLLGISLIVFIILALIPGDPATAILGSYATPENVARINESLGLNQPLCNAISSGLATSYKETLDVHMPSIDR